MFELSLQNYSATETDRAPGAIAREEDAVLIAAKRGDSAAFEVLCKQYAATVFHIARRMMRSKEDAEDVMQESFQSAFIHLKSFKGGSRFSTWLSRIAINAALMKLRKKRHLREVSRDEAAENQEPSFLLDVEDRDPDPEQLYAHKERQRILSEAMDALRPGLRKAIELRELGERSTKETAQIMGISASAVKARVFHGRKILRERLQGRVGAAWTSGRDTSQTIDNTRDSSQDQSPAMCVVKARRKGDSHGHTSAPHCFGDFGVSVLHRPGCYRLETSPLNLERQQGFIGRSARRVRRF